jgi:hypothetical protein
MISLKSPALKLAARRTAPTDLRPWFVPIHTSQPSHVRTLRQVNPEPEDLETGANVKLSSSLTVLSQCVLIVL